MPRLSGRCRGACVPCGGVLLVHHEARLKPSEGGQHGAEYRSHECADQRHERTPTSVGAGENCDNLQQNSQPQA